MVRSDGAEAGLPGAVLGALGGGAQRPINMALPLDEHLIEGWMIEREWPIAGDDVARLGGPIGRRRQHLYEVRGLDGLDAVNLDLVPRLAWRSDLARRFEHARQQAARLGKCPRARPQ